jgi:uncharacterized membrane protein
LDESDLGRRLSAIEARLAAVERQISVVTPSVSEAAGWPGGAPPEAHPLPPPVPPAASLPLGVTRGESLENRIGAHWLNRIGIAAVLVGAAFFLKYAFENEWVGPSMRIVIGVAIGIALLLWSERFPELFANTLKVVATGILYLSIWAASQTYALIGNAAAFASMALVSAALVALAIRHRSEFFAGLALTSGFLTPVLLSTAGNHEVELFSYVALLDVAAVVLLALFPWVRAMAVAFLGTLFLYVGWAADQYTDAQAPRTIAFITLFFVLFASVPLLRRWNERGIASAGVLLLPFANAFVYFVQLSVILSNDPHRLARYSVALAALFVAITFALRLRGSDRNDLAAVHIALALGFVTVAIPLQFDRVSVTVGWLAEAAALLTLQRRMADPAARMFRLLGGIALTLGVFRLLFLDDFRDLTPIFNERALLYAIAVAIFGGIALTRRANDALWKIAVFGLNFLAVVGLSREVGDLYSGIVRQFAWSALWMIYGAALMFAGFRLRNSYLRWLALLLIGITVGKVFLHDLGVLQRVYRFLAFIALGVMLLAISFAYQRKWIAIPEDAAS